MKLRMLNAWRLSSTRSLYGQQLAEAHEERDEAKTDLFNVQMEKDEEIKSLKDEIAALRKSLKQTEEQRQALQTQLSDEVIETICPKKQSIDCISLHSCTFRGKSTQSVLNNCRR
jgi:septal ring factor EnvC (AmiA/AmiB activator)